MSELYNFFDQNSLYLVMTIVLVIWFGICWYLFRLDKRIARLERAGKP